MIDYINPDVPKPVVEFVKADSYYGVPKDAKGRGIGYLTNIGNTEIYFTTGIYNEIMLTGYPRIIMYNCHVARRPTIEEINDVKDFMPKYLKNIKAEHVCHRDLPAFNQHNTPNPYKKKVKYFTPRYIPKTVIKYINKKYPISWYPGMTHRYIKYLTTYENKYEVYFVFWKDEKSDLRSLGKYILYDCKNAREYQNNKERVDLALLNISGSKYNSTYSPAFCSSKNK